MEEKFLKKHLGMAVYKVYYHHERLHNEVVFPEGYCEELKRAAPTPEYWNNVRRALSHALQQEDYCLSILNSPMKNMYPEEDIRLFFEKFHAYLQDCFPSNTSVQ